ncbi:hypothetical protein [Candidatus Ichthyocystis hellenicum]|uniref:hypothetical protein n=1 Tax=Candidatus Ichthyocystis hellenicum TaxID=1561003 RepID=UPI000B8667FE|nr:hypothetical protein [Candidatus Ichthyocystis hellenicum]
MDINVRSVLSSTASKTSDDSVDVPSTVSSVPDLIQVDLRFVSPSPVVVANFISSVNKGSLAEYLSSAHVLLETCMSRSMQCVRSINICSPAYYHVYNQLTSPGSYNTFLDPDPKPLKDEYILRSDGKYGRLEYMCDYFKYCLLGDDENDNEKDEEKELRKLEGEILSRYENKLSLKYKSKAVENDEHPESIYELAVDVKIDTKLGDRDRYGFLVSNVSKVVSWKLMRELKIMNDINSRRAMRNADLSSRDACIAYFMRYYLSLKDKLELIAKTKFKGEDILISKEFKIPLPEKDDMRLENRWVKENGGSWKPYYAKPCYANDACKINEDMKMVRERMGNYLMFRNVSAEVTARISSDN